MFLGKNINILLCLRIFVYLMEKDFYLLQIALVNGCKINNVRYRKQISV